MSRKLYVVGVGPGSRELVNPSAISLIERSDVLIGGKRNLEMFEELHKEKMVIGNNLVSVCEYILNNIDIKRIAVLATGDPGIFSITEYLKDNLTGVEIEVVPGISSIQYLCSRMKLSWHDMYIVSLHGKDKINLYNIIKDNKKVAVFTGGINTPDSICRELYHKGITNASVTVGENLSYPEERIISGTISEIGNMSFGSLSIMVIEYQHESISYEQIWNYTVPGIPDEMFIRGNVPITKEEVRTISISKLRLRKDNIVLDIGAGTGSISIECGLRCTNGIIYAVEKNPEAVNLIEKNISKFNLSNIKVIEGEAPGVLEVLPQPDRIFIGGSSGNMDSIIEWVCRLDSKPRVVANAVTIESAYEVIESFRKRRFENMEIINVGVSRGRSIGQKHLMQALNPVYIISAEKVV